MSLYLIACVSIFAAAYLLNAVTITVGYHRGLAHGAVALHPWVRRAVILAGNWVTGLDPKAWAVMHRLHHAHSDTPLDPHSPRNVGLLGIGLAQLKSYERVLVGLLRNDKKYTKHALDLDFPPSWLNRRRLWWLPYAIHLAIGVVLSLVFGGALIGLAYYFGMMSHPIQGGLVNSLGHAVGGRNFDLDDDSRNNHPVAWLILGEGFQNNHHRYAKSAKFSYRWFEIDMGWWFCRAFQAVGLLTIDREHLIPRPGETPPAEALRRAA